MIIIKLNQKLEKCELLVIRFSGIGFSNVITLGANLKAQKQAVVSANSALEATRVGYEVGTRNIVDLLQAEKNLYTAEKNLANAKYDYLLSELNLELAAGTLSPQSINEINGYLN